MDYSKECVAEFGSYVHGYGQETRSDNRSRTIEGIYLGPTPNLQEGHLIYDIYTRKTNTRPRIKEIPMSQQVIKIIEGIAAEEGVHDLRTYTKRNGELILDADLLAGVDPDELWDENYIQNDDSETQSDIDLPSDNISDEEVEALITDAQEDILATRGQKDLDDQDKQSIESSTGFENDKKKKGKWILITIKTNIQRAMKK